MGGETQWRTGVVGAVRNRKPKADHGNEALLLNCSACGPAGPQLPISKFGNRIRDGSKIRSCLPTSLPDDDRC
ncbi:unnamed protein product [Clonostachys byssicola]|uniref:Uncharacterized protein n=1 Tax=Clonostachys byssicola TaxID=160290 RepID=A0A9N9U2J4_9HYPO|nr:unnamed protein product [Clonostachys byssicola]